MLIEIKIANFRSIREQQVFSLVASNSDKELDDCVIKSEFPGLAGVRLLKGAALYGANASGKSNVLSAILYVAGFVRRSATVLQPGDSTGAEPFKLDVESQRQPCKFELAFIHEGVRYEFGLAVTPERVIDEYLVAYPKGSPQRWYHRSFNPDTQSYDWAKPSSSFRADKSLEEKTRSNSLFLSVGPQFNHPQLTTVFDWFRNHLRFIDLAADRSLVPTFTARLVTKPTHHDRIIGLLRNADVGVADANVKEEERSIEELKSSLTPEAFARLEKQGGVRPLKRFDIQLTHQAEGLDPVPFNFNHEESDGTRRFFYLIGPWTDILDNGYTVFVDEIETSLHPLLIKELLKLLLCDEHNPKGAQVVFTTHNAVLLDSTLLRRDQIWFTEKLPSGATQLYPLTDYSPRKDEALEKGYLAGRYGAVPYLPHGLKS